MKKSIYFLFAIFLFSFHLISCNGPTQKKVDVSKLKGGDIFLGNWIDKKNDLKLNVSKTNDTTYKVNAPAKTGSGYMGFQTTFKDNKLICGKESNGDDWVILTYANEKVTTIINGEVFEREE